ncbi:MAG: hypothetical protein JSW49_00825 [candidate division WOR-3 bacterium]|nr:MAG: hypothetical protein JSW49_00825 [candidate division WOR-3 bacterium]
MLSRSMRNKIKKLDSTTRALLRSTKRTKFEDRRLSDNCREILRLYEDIFSGDACKKGWPSDKEQRKLTSLARAAMLYLGGDPDPNSMSLKDYDHERYGPYLGISDEGSAAHVIREAGLNSPKMTAIGKADPIVVGVAHDAERLGAIGEVPVGPEEYTDIRLQCVGRILTSTNVGTRLNLRYYKHYPEVYIHKGTTRKSLSKAKKDIRDAFEPFVKTPDGRPRPLIVFIRFAREVRDRVNILKDLIAYAANRKVTVPALHRLGLLVRITYGKKGQKTAREAIDLASRTGLRDVALDGFMRGAAKGQISLPGLLNFLPPSMVAPVLRHAKANRVSIYPRNIVDPDTVARNVWSTLNSARHMGLELGKYGTFPLTLEECDEVIGKVEKWFKYWTAAPVFFVDQGILSRERVYVRSNVVAGLKEWLKIVRRHNVPVVLIDTVDKSKGWRLLRKGKDKKGLLTTVQIQEVNDFAANLGIKVLWAGGISLPQTFEFGRMGVFGIYVTSAAASKEPVSIQYERDPLLASLKEPSVEGVCRTKLLLEAGFLVSHVRRGKQAQILERSALSFIQSIDAWTKSKKRSSAKNPRQAWKDLQKAEQELFEKTVTAWKVFLKIK